MDRLFVKVLPFHSFSEAGIRAGIFIFFGDILEPFSSDFIYF